MGSAGTLPQDLRGVRRKDLINSSGTKKSPHREIRAFFHKKENQLLDFAFFVDHVLANARVEHFLFELVRGSTLVLVGSVEVTSTGARDHSNQFTHDLAP
jgi:hypothetical protein